MQPLLIVSGRPGANKVDIAAAGRFIAAAIPRAQRLAAETADDNVSTAAESSRASTPAVEVPDVGMASRFKMARDAQSEKLASEAEDAASVVEEAPEQQAVSRFDAPFDRLLILCFRVAYIETQRQACRSGRFLGRGHTKEDEERWERPDQDEKAQEKL